MSLVLNYVSRSRAIIPANFTYVFPDEIVPEEKYVADDFTFVLYTFILPVICTLGVMGNIASFLVLFGMKVKCSSYTYLTVLLHLPATLSCQQMRLARDSAADNSCKIIKRRRNDLTLVCAVKTASDLAVCFLLLLSVVVHGFFRNMDGEDFDLLLTLPAASIFSGISVFATVSVTIDRLLVLRKPTNPVKPAICTPQAARRIMAGSIFTSAILNIPYFFIFALRDDGYLHPTNFFYSCVYYYYNWVRFFIFGILPAAVLTVTTVLLIISIKRISYQLRHLSCRGTANSWDPTRMTVTLIAIAIFFLIGEVPGHIISKKAAFVFLYSGDASSVITDDKDLEIMRQVSLIFGAVNCSINFLIFYMLHPPFGKGLKQLFCKKKELKEEKQKPVMVNVFVISHGDVLNEVKKIDFGNVRNGRSILPKFYDFNTFISR